MKYVIFDMDGTLFKTPGPESNIKEPNFQNAKNWWKSPESLSLDLHIPGLDGVHQKVFEAMKDPNTYVILITHRQPKLKNEIIALLKHYGLGFNKIIITPSSNKKTDILIKNIPKIKNAESIIVYEDSVEQMLDYKTMFDKLNIPITLKLITLRHIATLENIEVSNMEEIDYLYK